VQGTVATHHIEGRHRPEVDEDSDSATEIGGGSILIHKK
jgi:hypothetical protein